MKGTKFKAELKLAKILFPKNQDNTEGGFAIASFKIVKTLSSNVLPVHEKYKTVTLKGVMPPMKEKDNITYIADIVEVEASSYGRQFQVENMRSAISFDRTNPEQVRNFLKYVVTDNQLKNLYETYDNPVEVIESDDAINKIAEVKGFGTTSAERLVEKYFANLDNSFAMSRLGKYNISKEVINKVCYHYKSPELAVKKVEENPYQLSEITGYSFRKCDAVFLAMGGSVSSIKRVEAYIEHIFKELKNNGNTYIRLKDLVNEVKGEIPNVDMGDIGKIVGTDKFIIVTLDNGEKVIALSKYAMVEMNIAQHLKEMLTDEPTIKFSEEDFEKSLSETEEKQGWKYAETQRKAMSMMLNNNVFILQGLGGTGKTTTLKAVLDYYDSQNIPYLQTALSGKASNNLAIVTGKEGNTIHMALIRHTKKFKDEKGREKEIVDIPYPVVIIDEMSMVDAELFLRFLKGLRKGTKLFMVGDTKQLESIGIPVMLQMVQSGYIPTVTLTEVHRQAQDSAITMDSIAIRNGDNVFEKGEKFVKIDDNAKMTTHGKNKDLHYVIVRNDDDILKESIRQFKTAVIDNKMNILDVQIITQVKDIGKSSCFNINKYCQQIYNPYSATKRQVEVKYNDKMSFVIREGDKVINTKTDRTCKAYDESKDNYEGEVTPVYNGSTGVCLSISDDLRSMVVEYEGIGKVIMRESNIKNMLLGYCITVHKSQGSENKTVIVALPVQYMLNSREMLYTAITRARENCFVIGKRKTITDCIRKESATQKHTLLTYFIKYIFEIRAS